MRVDGLFEGEKVKLVPFEAERDSKNIASWRSNSEYLRLADGDIALQFSVENIKKWLEEQELSDSFAFFFITTKKDDEVIGEISLAGFKGKHCNAFVGISIGDPNNWGKGYGTDAMRIIIKYAFSVLNLNHVSLTVFEYNQRGVRSYEKAGFTMEAVQRKFLNRDGKRWDMYRMGILKSEWLESTQRG